MDERIGYRPERAAEVLSVGRTTMYELMRSGEIESVKVGRARIVPAEALHTYMRRLRTEQTRATA